MLAQFRRHALEFWIEVFARVERGLEEVHHRQLGGAHGGAEIGRGFDRLNIQLFCLLRLLEGDNLGIVANNGTGDDADHHLIINYS